MSIVLRAACVALFSAACACGPTPRSEPVAPSATSSATAIPAAPATTPTASTAPAEPDVTSPLLPFPLSRLPAELHTFALDHAYARTKVLEAVCGDPDIERRLLSTSPAYEARGLAHAFNLTEEARRILLCRREVGAKLGPTIQAWEVIFPLPGISSEDVHFFRLDIENLPATASYAHDASTATGLPWARCFYAFHAPDRPCSELSEAIGKWPEGNLWVSGRVNGLATAFEAYRSNKGPHPRAAEVRAALDVGRDFDLERVMFDTRDGISPREPGNFILHGFGADGARVSRFVLKTEDDAVKREGELEQERKTRLERPVEKKGASRCKDCPPGLGDLLGEIQVAADAKERKVVAQQQIRRDGRMVERRRPKVDDAALEKAQAAFHAAQAQRAAKVAILLDEWMAGKPPKPEAFRETQGQGFVDALRENMR